MSVIKRFACALDLLQDVGGFGRPDEWFRGFVVMVDVVSDGCDQFLHVAEDAAADPLLGQITEEPFDHVEPGTARGCEMHVKARVLGQPPLHFVMLVGRVVVGNQMELLLRRGDAVRV